MAEATNIVLDMLLQAGKENIHGAWAQVIEREMRANVINDILSRRSGVGGIYMIVRYTFLLPLPELLKRQQGCPTILQ